MSIEEQAREMAQENMEAESFIQTIYWFPDEKEVRLLELIPSVKATGDKIEITSFPAIPEKGLLNPSAIAMIRPEEFNEVNLPESWGTWEDAVELL